MGEQIKNRIQIISLVLVFLVPLVLILPASAQDSEPELTNPQEQRTQRINERKAKATAKLTAAQQRRIQARCKAAQVKLGTLSTKGQAVQTKQVTRYADITTKLEAVATAAKSNGADVTELTAQIAMLQEKSTALIESFNTYINSVDDSAVLDCIGDPVAFKASLDSGRAGLKELRSQSAEIRAYLKDTIRPTLTALKEASNTDAQGAN